MKISLEVEADFFCSSYRTQFQLLIFIQLQIGLLSIIYDIAMIKMGRVKVAAILNLRLSFLWLLSSFSFLDPSAPNL